MTVSLKLAEQVCDDVIVKLQANYAARAATVNAAFNDGVTIVAPDTDSYYVGGQQAVAKAPFVVVTDGGTDFTRESEGSHGLTSTLGVLVFVCDEDPSRQVLARKLWRHCRCAIEAVWDSPPVESLNDGNNGAALNSAWIIRPRRTLPGHLLDPQQPDAFRAFYTVEFTARQIEA